MGDGTMNEMKAFEERKLSAFKALATIKEQKKQLDLEEKAMNDLLLEHMQENGIMAIDNDIIRINLVPESESVSLDTKALRAEDPDLYHEIECKYNKKVKKRAHIRVTVK